MVWLGVLALFLVSLTAYLFWRLRRLRHPHLWEDALKTLLETEALGQPCPPPCLARRLRLTRYEARRLLDMLQAQGLVEGRNGRLVLTPQGRGLAYRVLRTHRLLERYYADYTDIPLDQVHRMADRAEHHLDEAQVHYLAATLGHPQHDPHGDPIPHTPEDAAVQEPAQPLSQFPPGRTAHIVHIEDQPEAVFAQIVDVGLWPGQHLRVLRREGEDVEVLLLESGERLWLPGTLARQIHVRECAEASAGPRPWTLAEVPLGQRVRVVGLSPRLRGLLRRRLLDLGFTPGAVVVPVMASAFGRGDPRAYRIRGTTIALRREQAQGIWVEPVDSQQPTVVGSERSAVSGRRTADSG